MKKIAITLLLILSMFFDTAYAASMILEYDGAVRNYTGNIYNLEVNGKRLTNLPLEPIIFNDRALVPVREIFEAMDATVAWEPKDKSINISHGKTSVFLKIDSTTAKVNGVTTDIPDKVAPKLIAKWGESAKTMVPVRFISESIGMDVNFSEKDGLISISEPGKTLPADNTLKQITYFQDGDVVNIRITAQNEITSVTKPAVTEKGVVYVDIANTNYTISQQTVIELGAVVSVRMGTHSTSSRIAVDTAGMTDYSVDLSKDKKTIIFKITDDNNTKLDDETKLPTASPEPSQKPTQKPSQKPSRPVANPDKLIVVLDPGHGGQDPGVVRNRFTEEELLDWNKVKTQPSPTPSATSSPEPTKAPTAEDDKEIKPSESPAPKTSAWEGGSGDMYKEKDIALSVALKVKKLLEEKDVTVLMTRNGDTYPTLDERPEFAIENSAALFLSLHINSTNDTVTNANGIEIYYSTQNNGDSYGITSKEFAANVLKNVISGTKAKDRGVKTANYLVIRKSIMPAALIEMGFLNNPDEFENLISDGYQDKIAEGITKGIITTLAKVTIPEEPVETPEPSQTPEPTEAPIQK